MSRSLPKISCVARWRFRASQHRHYRSFAVFSLLRCGYGSYGRDNLAPPSSFSVPVAAQEIPLELVFQISVTRFRSDGWQAGSNRADEKPSPHDEVPEKRGCSSRATSSRDRCGTRFGRACLRKSCAGTARSVSWVLVPGILPYGSILDGQFGPCASLAVAAICTGDPSRVSTW